MPRAAGDVRIVQEDRRTLALRVTPDGLVAAIPHELAPDDPKVQAFVANGLRKLPRPNPLPESAWLSVEDLEDLVRAGAARLSVRVVQLRVRSMRRKWASISSKGTLTLAREMLHMPRDLMDYVICHELLHLRVPTHSKGFRAMLSAHIPDWRERELQLAGWALMASDLTSPHVAAEFCRQAAKKGERP